MGDFDPQQMKQMMGSGAMGQNGMDFANMMSGMGGGMGGMGGGMPDLGGMADDDSDDEEGEESQVDPHKPSEGEEVVEEKPAAV